MNADIEKYRIVNKLKSTYRFASVGNRKESSAEHSWGCLLLADYFLSSTRLDLDRVKVYELLMYHDLVEIEAGDTPTAPGVSQDSKLERERQGAKKLSQKLPGILVAKYTEIFSEYVAQKTVEARFAAAIDALEAEIHELDYRQDWKGWTLEFLKAKKAHLFTEFPELKEVFVGITDYLVKEGYFI